MTLTFDLVTWCAIPWMVLSQTTNRPSFTVNGSSSMSRNWLSIYSYCDLDLWTSDLTCNLLWHLVRSKQWIKFQFNLMFKCQETNFLSIVTVTLAFDLIYNPMRRVATRNQCTKIEINSINDLVLKCLKTDFLSIVSDLDLWLSDLTCNPMWSLSQAINGTKFEINKITRGPIGPVSLNQHTLSYIAQDRKTANRVHSDFCLI